MSDDISKAFDSVRPEDLMQLESAHFLEHTPGPESFEQLVKRHLYAIRYAYAAADGSINPVCVLSDGRVERLFAARDDETISDLAARLKALARQTGATRFFFSRVVPVAPTVLGAAQMNEGDADWTEAVLWYAEDKTSGQRRQGSMNTLGINNLGEVEEFQEMGGVLGGLLHAVLD